MRRALLQRAARAPVWASGGTVRRSPAFTVQRWSSSAPSRPTTIGLQEQLKKAIEATGPVSVANYMRQCLTSMDHGYYSRTPESQDQIGQRGDFVTSPELSQVFGELVAIWIVSEWMAQGRKSSGVHLVELGPGRGTLMDDVLRTLRNFPPLFNSLEGVTLVESSENLRQMQSKRLCPEGSTPTEAAEIAGYTSTSKYSKDLKISWTGESRFIPSGENVTPFIIAHEFFDALPIHIFQSVETPLKDQPEAAKSQPQSTPPPKPQRPQNRWRELLVDTKALPQDPKPSDDSFQLRISNHDTPHSLLLPLSSPRYDAIKQLPAGSTIEVSPESLSLARRLAIHIGGSSAAPSNPKAAQRRPVDQSSPTPKPPSGAALIIDYGPADTVPANSMRGIKSHARVSPFTEPGIIDLSADVDFSALADAALDASPDVEVHGPVPQGFFLRALGGQARVDALAKRADGKDADLRKRIETGWSRLVGEGPNGMGAIYKAMAIVPRVEGKEGRRPVGFGGDVVA